MNTIKRQALTGLAILCAFLPFLLAGCGGGGGGGGPTTPQPPDTVNGSVTDNSGTEPNGDIVKFDNRTASGVDGAVTETGGSSTTGTYSLTVPIADITGSDSLWIYDSGGSLLDIVAIAMPAGSGQTVSPSPSDTVLPTVPPPSPFTRRP